MTKRKIKAKRVGIIPDSHIPYEDKRAYDLTIKVMQEHDPEEIVLLGDYADFYGVGGHGKTPGLAKSFMQEVEAVNARLDELDKKFPRAKKVYICGNHEWRLDRYVAKNAEDLDGLISVPQMFCLKQRKNWTWVPYTSDQLYQVAGSKLYARHEPLGGGTHVAHGSVVKAGCSLVFGHTHRLQESQVVMANGDQHRGISLGWLGDPKHRVMSYVAGFHQWSQGFGLVHVYDKGLFFFQTVHIINHKCHALGKLWVG